MGPSYAACLEYFPNKWSAAGLMALAITLLIGTARLSLKTSMIRDVGIPPPDTLAPYSLARFQMALWFVTVIFAVLFAYAVTGDISPIPDGALILMGIGAGTAVVAAAIDVSNLPGTMADYRELKKAQAVHDDAVKKLQQQVASEAAANANDPALPELRKQLEAATKAATDNSLKLKAFEVPASRHFIRDILGDGSGVAFHRLQVFGWTMVYWVFFVTAIFHKITLIDFAISQLALLGISGATYLGFKLQEQPKPAPGAGSAKEGTHTVGS